MNDKSSSLVSMVVLLTLTIAICINLVLATANIIFSHSIASIYHVVMALISCFGLWLWIKDPK